MRAKNPILTDVRATAQRTHLAAVFDGKQFNLFVDGKFRGKSDWAEANLTNKLQSGSKAFAGVIDEIRVSKIARYDNDFKPDQRFEPDADTLALFHCDEGQGDELKDSSGTKHHGKIGLAKWVNADGSPIVVDAERRVAEWALSVGWMVEVREGDQTRTVQAVPDLPKGAFQVEGIGAAKSTLVSKDQLVNLQGLKFIKSINLHGSKIGNLGLVHLKNLRSLVELNLTGAPVSDKGLPHLEGLTNLTSLKLQGTLVTADGVAALQKALPKCKIEWEPKK